MNSSDLFKSLQEVDEELLLRSEVGRMPKHFYMIIRAIAASLALMICGFGLWLALDRDSAESVESLFAVVARAENGVSTEMNLNDSCFNSGGSGESLFHVDFPLFDFVVTPADRQETGQEFFRYDITVSYNGKVVGPKDDHIMVSFMLPVSGSNAPAGYGIVGWFEEPTNIKISLSDKTSGEMVEELTISVCYLPESQGYALTVTESSSCFYEASSREVYQLTEEQLRAPTEELVDAVLEYPYLIDLFSGSSSSVSAYASLRDSFNGLAELEKREDAAAVMLSKYAAAVDLSGEDVSIETLYLRVLLSEPVYAQQLAEGEKTVYFEMLETAANR